MVLYFSKKHKLIIRTYIKNKELLFNFSNEIILIVGFIFKKTINMYLIFYII